MTGRKFIGLTAAVCLALTAGCGSKGGDSSEPESKEKEFTYTVPEELVAGESSADVYTLKENEDVLVFIYETNTYTACSFECYGESIKASGSDEVKESFEVRHIGEHDVYYYTELSKTSDSGEYLTVYDIPVSDRDITINCLHPEDMRDAVDKAAVKVIETLKFTGDTSLPDKERTIKCDYASVKADPKWSEWNVTLMNAELTLGYSYAEDLAHYYSAVFLNDETKDDYKGTAEEVAQQYYDNITDEFWKDTYGDIQAPEKGTIGGKEAYRVSCILKDDRLADRVLDTWIVKGKKGPVFLNVIAARYDGWETVHEELTELADSIVIK